MQVKPPMCISIKAGCRLTRKEKANPHYQQQPETKSSFPYLSHKKPRNKLHGLLQNKEEEH